MKGNRRRTTRRLQALLAGSSTLVLLLLAFPGPASAQTNKTWIGGGTGDWSVDANWDPAGVPTQANNVVIVNSDVTFSAPQGSVNSFRLGDGAGQTMLTIQGGALLELGSFSVSVVGVGGGAVAELVVTGPGTILRGDGTTSATGGSLTVAGDPDTNAFFTLSDGATATLGSVTLGILGTGNLRVTGPDSALTVGVATFGTGNVRIEQGGRLTSTRGSFVSDSASSGVVSVVISGQGSSWTASSVSVGHRGSGTVTIEDGGHLNAGFLFFGAIGANANGAARVDGATSVLSATAAMFIGGSPNPDNVQGTGTITLTDGGVLRARATNGDLFEIELAATRPSASGTIRIGDGGAAGIVQASEIRFGEGTGTLVFNHNESNYAFDALLTSTGAGSHAIDVLAGTTNLNGVSGGFAGDTTISGGRLNVTGSLGGTVVVNSGGTLGGTGTVGAVTVANGGILAPGSSIGTLTVSGDLMLNQTSQLHYEIGAPGTIGSPGSGDMVAVGGNLTLDGQLHLFDGGGAGIGHYRLITYAGGLTDNTLDVVTPGPVGGATYTVQTGGGNVDLVIAGGGGPVIGDPTLQYWQDNSATWDAVDTDWRNSGGDVDVVWAGNHGVFNGTGSTIAVDGTQSFRGLQFVTSNYVLAGTGALQTIAGGSELRVLGGETATIDTEITGTGGITRTQGGTLILTGVNSYAGPTVIEAGTLALQGAGAIASSSALSFTGAGTFDVAAVTTGTTTVGTLSGVAGSQVRLGNIDLVVHQASAGAFAGVIGGSGDVEKAGTGVLTLTGESTYAGLTNVSAGTLRIGDGGTSGSVSGDILNNASLVFDRSNGFSYGGVLSGAGDLTKLGAGMMTLTGNSGAYAGSVGVEAGNLRIASGGTMGTSLLTVEANGTLSGLGTIVGDVSVPGTLAPGEAALGVLTVSGDVAFDTGSTFAVRIASNGDNDALAATTVSVAGDVAVTTIDPHTSYVDGQTYTIVTTTDPNGVTGTFGSTTMLTHSAFLTPTLTHNADNVVLNIAVTADFTTVAETFNQDQAATALNDLEQSGDALVVFNEIAMLNTDDARRAFDLSSGEVHASGQHVIDQTFGLFSRTLRGQASAGLGGMAGGQVFTAPLGYSTTPRPASLPAGIMAADTPDLTIDAYASERVANAWLAPLGQRGTIDGDGNAAALDWWTAGLAGGYEGPIDVASGNAWAGFGLGYMRGHGSVDARLSTLDADTFQIGVYGGWADGPWTLAGSLAYGASHIDTKRRIVFGGIDRRAQADYWSHTVGFSGEAAYGFNIATGTTLSPLFTLDAGWSGHGSFTETGAGALNLNGASESRTRLDTGLGIATSHVVLTESGKVTLNGRAVWEHAFADVVPSQSLAFAGRPTGFTVKGPDAGRDRFRVGAGISFEATEDLTIRASYDGVFSGSQQNHTASLGLNVKF